MPQHDWTRIDAGDCHDFHLNWIAAIRTRLNTGLLPPNYYALAERVNPPYTPDVLTLEESPAEGGGADPWGGPGGAATLTRTEPAFVKRSRGRSGPRPPQRRVAVRTADGKRLVAVIEVVSPSNRKSRVGRAAFAAKSAEYLRAGVSVLVLDPFPATARVPDGFATPIWREVTRTRLGYAAAKSVTHSSFAARDAAGEYAAYVYGCGFGERLPAVPLFYAPGLSVTLPLEETYMDSYRGCPRFIRDALEAPPAAPPPAAP